MNLNEIWTTKANCIMLEHYRPLLLRRCHTHRLVALSEICHYVCRRSIEAWWHIWSGRQSADCSAILVLTCRSHHLQNRLRNAHRLAIKRMGRRLPSEKLFCRDKFTGKCLFISIRSFTCYLLRNLQGFFNISLKWIKRCMSMNFAVKFFRDKAIAILRWKIAVCAAEALQ